MMVGYTTKKHLLLNLVLWVMPNQFLKKDILCSTITLKNEPKRQAKMILKQKYHTPTWWVF